MRLQRSDIERADVVVLGAGISGLTSAIVLQALGKKVAIVADDIPLQKPHHERSFVATDFAMASAYPHHLQIENLERITTDSQAMFRLLLQHAMSGVHKYRMYEVFEGESPAAPMADARMSFQTFAGKPEQLASTLGVPFRPGAEHVSGYVFDTYFLDMPVYLSKLRRLFNERGGTCVMAHLEPGDLDTLLRDRAVVNCLGLGAKPFMNDRSDHVLMRGIQIIVKNAPTIVNEQSVQVAYNYTPTAEHFSRADGKPEYVHFFSRSDGWVLGQTREPGRLSDNGEWIGEPVPGPQITVGGVEVPKAIWELNAAIVNQWTPDGRGKPCPYACGDALQNAYVRIGYRYYRDPAGGGVRLECEPNNAGAIVHNYGHGGSGITVSWGCAVRVAELLGEENVFARLADRLGMAERARHASPLRAAGN